MFLLSDLGFIRWFLGFFEGLCVFLEKIVFCFSKIGLVKILRYGLVKG